MNAENTERSLLDGAIHYLGILKQRKLFIIATTGVAALASIVFAVVSIALPPDRSPLPNVYTAQAILFVTTSEQSSISDSILGALGVDQQTRASTGFSIGDMILEILRSRTILDRLTDDFKLAERYGIGKGVRGKTRETLLGKSRFVYSRNTGSIRIFFEDTDPVFARDVVNRMVELLEEWFVLNRGLAKEKFKQTLEDKLKEVSGDIANLQNRLKSLQRRYGVLNAQELGVSQAESLASLRSQLIMKEIEIKNYSIYSKVNDPRWEQLNEELRNLRELINKNQLTIPEATQESGTQRSVADVAQEFTQLTAELDIQQRIYNTLSPQFEAMKLAPESEAMFQVFEKADTPDVKSGPMRSQLVMMAAGGGFALSVGITLLLHLIEAERRKLKNVRHQRGDSVPDHQG